MGKSEMWSCNMCNWVALWSVVWLEARRFIEDQCLEGLFGQVVEFHVEFERSLGDRLRKNMMEVRD